MFYTKLLTACVCNVMFARDDCNEITRISDCINLGGNICSHQRVEREESGGKVRTKCGDIKAAAISPSSHSHHIQIRRWRAGHGAKQNCNEPTRGEKWSCQRSFTNFHSACWSLVRKDHKQFGYHSSLKSTIGYDSDLSNLPIACLLREGWLIALARRV